MGVNNDNFQEVASQLEQNEAQIEAFKIISEIESVQDYFSDISLESIPDFDLIQEKGQIKMAFHNPNYEEELKKNEKIADKKLLSIIGYILTILATGILTIFITHFWSIGFILMVIISIYKDNLKPVHVTKYSEKRVVISELNDTLRSILKLSKNPKMSRQKHILDGILEKYCQLNWIIEKTKEEIDELDQSIEVAKLLKKETQPLKDKKLALNKLIDDILLYNNTVSSKIDDIQLLASYAGNQIELTADNLDEAAAQIMSDINIMLDTITV